MSGKLFAFNVSKKVESFDGKVSDQWIGDQTARGTYCSLCYCTEHRDYGVACIEGPLGDCDAGGGPGYFSCDAYGT